jgi:hypothetical protein
VAFTVIYDACVLPDAVARESPNRAWPAFTRTDLRASLWLHGAA